MLIKLYEKYIDIKDIKETLILKAIETDNVNMIDFFVKKGYDINFEEAILLSTFNNKIFRYFLKNKIKIDESIIDYEFKNRLRDVEVQKALIDFGHEQIIKDTVGFDFSLKNDPNSKYADVIRRYEDVDKYNL